MKLKTCTISTEQAYQLTPMEKEKDRLIKYISRRSNRYGNKLIEFMSMYQLTNLKSATVTQLKNYVDFLAAQAPKVDRTIYF